MNKAQLNRLAILLAQNSMREGLSPTALPGVEIFRASSASTPIPVVYNPSLCVLAQGQKNILWNSACFDYTVGQFLVVTVDLPLQSQITEASISSPYLLLKVDLDTSLIAELLPCTPFPERPAITGGKGLVVGAIESDAAAAIMRLAELMATPEHIPALAETTRREVIYRLLSGPHGASIALMANRDSCLHRIGKSVRRIKDEFHTVLSVAKLAEHAGMSISSFHFHFKNVTGQSPLQFQKSLRLHAARNLMAAGNLDAASSAFRVGYESVSQFSREYARMFGNPPARDIHKLKQQRERR